MATKLAATHMRNLASTISKVSGLLRIHAALTGRARVGAMQWRCRCLPEPIYFQARESLAKEGDA
jgi:hypothetical protein